MQTPAEEELPAVSAISAVLPTPDHFPAGSSMQGQAGHGTTGLQQVKVPRLFRVSSPAPSPHTEGSRAARSRLQAAAGKCFDAFQYRLEKIGRHI